MSKPLYSTNMNNSLPKAILFDLDDTILASTTLASDIWRRVCDQIAPRIAGLGTTELFEAIERERELYWGNPDLHRRGRLNPMLASKEVPQGALEKLGINDPSLAIEIGDAYQAGREDLIHLFPGALDVLGRLRERDVSLALITNGNADVQRGKVERFGLASFFDCILIEGQFGMGKPDERVYLHAMGHIDALPSGTWMVGDHLEWEIAAPQELGIAGVWVDNRGAGVPESSAVRPDRIIRGVSELI